MLVNQYNVTETGDLINYSSKFRQSEDDPNEYEENVKAMIVDYRKTELVQQIVCVREI